MTSHDRARYASAWGIRAGWALLPHQGLASDVDVVVSSGRIVAVGPGVTDSLAPARVVQAPESTLLPGLIDSHVHLTFNSDEHIRRDSGELDDETQLEHARRNAASTLRRGVTTAIDCGGRTSVVLQLRENLQADCSAGPRLLVSGAPITTPGGHCHWLGGSAEGRVQVIQVSRRLIEHGVDFIKVMLTGGNITEGSSPHELQFTEEDFGALAKECKGMGVPVVAHVHSEEALAMAAQHRVRVAAHATCASSNGTLSLGEETISALVAGGTVIDPTIMVGARTDFPGANERSLNRHQVRQGMLPHFRRMHEAGIPLMAGTDAGVPGVSHGQAPEAVIALHREVGLSVQAALESATAVPAATWGLDGRTGSIREGLVADLILVDGDVQRDIGRLAHPTRVWREGVNVANEDS